MAEISLGVIFPNGRGPTQATANLTTPAPFPPLMAHSYRVQPMPGNTGIGVVGSQQCDFSSGDGVYGFVPAPASAADSVWPYYESPKSETEISNPYDMSSIYIDALVLTDSFLVTYYEA